jgi:hypothetical protein
MNHKRAPQAPEPIKPLTPTDEEILRTVSTYRYMTACDVAYSLFSPNSISHVRRLLAALAGQKDYQERHCLYRFPLSSAKAGNRDRVYTLGAAGRALVEEFGIPVEWSSSPAKTTRMSTSHLLHELLVMRFVVAACWWVSRQPEYSLAEVLLSAAIEKRMAKLSQEQEKILPTMVPDAWLHFERQSDSARTPVLLELDRGSEYQERFKNHVHSRLAFIQRGDYAKVFHTPAVIICYVTTGEIPDYAETRRKSMAAWTREVLKERNMASWAGIFRFTTVSYETLYKEAQALFTKPVWYRLDSTSPVPLLEP